MTDATGQSTPTPWLIQGGMGIAISGWPLARAVASSGQLGVVSGTAIDSVFARRLQDEGLGDALRGVLERFPLQSAVRDALERFGTRRAPGEPYRVVPMLTHRNVQRSVDLVVLAAFAEVAMAKLGHSGLVGMNLLTKVQLPTVPALFGAILAGVDYVMMGAGMPTHIPGIIGRLTRGEAIDTPLTLAEGPSDQAPNVRFDPLRYLPGDLLRRPKFLGIVSSHVMATALARRSNGPVDGFVVERPSAGGHNAPPRGTMTLDAAGNPEYGERDRIDYDVIRGLDVPFWVGGGITSREDVREALSLGATGVQVGTLFAYCRESGMEPSLRHRVLSALRRGPVEVRTSTRASSTGYPFKVASVEGTIAEPDVYEARERRCDLGYLREAVVGSAGAISYRCAAEPVKDYVRKGGHEEDTVGVTCLCNGLMATCGLGQVRDDGSAEAPIVTSGDRLEEVRTLLADRDSFGAADVIEFLDPCPLPLPVETSATSRNG